MYCYWFLKRNQQVLPRNLSFVSLSPLGKREGGLVWGMQCWMCARQPAMDNLMKVVTTALEWTYEAQDTEVGAKWLKSAAELLVLRDDTARDH